MHIDGVRLWRVCCRGIVIALRSLDLRKPVCSEQEAPVTEGDNGVTNAARPVRDQAAEAREIAPKTVSSETPQRPSDWRQRLRDDYKRLSERGSRMAQFLVRWFQDNSFTPAWLPPRWRRPGAGYIFATGVQTIAIALTWWLVRVFSGFPFQSAIQLLGVIVVALSFGAGPSLFATALGTVLLGYVVLPPHFSWVLAQDSDVLGLVLYLAVGCVASVLPSQTERARKDAEELAVALAAERSRQEAMFEAIADGVYVYDQDAHLVRSNTAAQVLNPRITDVTYLSTAFARRAEALAPRDEHGQPIPSHDMPVQRVLRGEVLTGERAVDTTLRDATGRDAVLNTTGAPIRDTAGRIVGAVIVSRDVTARRLLERRTHDALNALLAIAEALVHDQPPDLPEHADDADHPSTQRSAMMSLRLAQLTCDVLGCYRVAILSIEPETRLMRPVALVGMPPEQERQWWAEQEAHEMRFGEGPDPSVFARLEEGEAIVMDYRQPPFDQLPNPYGITTNLTAPMRVGDQMVGLLALDYGGSPHDFTAEEIALSEAVARLTALVIERERLIRERAQAQANELALREANRRMDVFLGVASHELKTPLTSLKTSAQLLERRLGSVQPEAQSAGDLAQRICAVQPLIETSARSIGRLQRLVDDLLDMSRIQEDKLDLRLQPVDLTALVTESVEEQRRVHPARAVRLETPVDTAVRVEGDPDRIVQAITNFLTNALKYSEDDRPVDVTVRAEPEHVRVLVRDQGPGLPPQDRERVWERFHRASGIEVRSGSGVGLGLGLYITRTIIERHGGQVGVESEPGQGSTFWFSLPRIT